MTTISEKSAPFARIILGLAFAVFGLNGFLHFLPTPPYDGPAGQFLGGLAAAGYFFPLLKGTEVLVGLALLGNRFVPLALTILAPITINIFAFHAFVAGSGTALPIFLAVLQVALAYHHREAFRGVLSAGARGPVRAAPASRKQAGATA